MSEKEERCSPCEISVAGGTLIKDHCQGDCEIIINKFGEGNMSLNDLAGELGVNKEELTVFSNEGIDLDLTLKKAVDNYNKV